MLENLKTKLKKIIIKKEDLRDREIELAPIEKNPKIIKEPAPIPVPPKDPRIKVDK